MNACYNPEWLEDPENLTEIVAHFFKVVKDRDNKIETLKVVIQGALSIDHLWVWPDDADPDPEHYIEAQALLGMKTSFEEVIKTIPENAEIKVQGECIDDLTSKIEKYEKALNEISKQKYKGLTLESAHIATEALS